MKKAISEYLREKGYAEGTIYKIKPGLLLLNYESWKLRKREAKRRKKIKEDGLQKGRDSL